MITYHYFTGEYLVWCGGLALVQLSHIGVLVDAEQGLLAAVGHDLSVGEGADRWIADILCEFALYLLVIF